MHKQWRQLKQKHNAFIGPLYVDYYNREVIRQAVLLSVGVGSQATEQLRLP